MQKSNEIHLPHYKIPQPSAVLSIILNNISGPNINARSTGQRRPSFKEGEFFTDISANAAYNRNNQRSRILSKCQNCSFVNRGHLAPRADFVYEEWQDATFNYINAVPQFVNFNSGNWQSMEDAVRKYAQQTSAILQVGGICF